MGTRPGWVIALLVSGALSACGDGGSVDDAGRVEVAASHESPSSAALLTVDDLPEGWQEAPASDGVGGSSCLDMLAAPGGPFDEKTAPTATFAAGKNGPFLAASVIDGPADEMLPEINRILVACDGTTSPQGFTTSINAASLPGLPDGSLAVQGTDTAKSGSTIRYTIASAGTDEATAFVLALTPLGEIDMAVVVSAINAMHSRLPGS